MPGVESTPPSKNFDQMLYWGGNRLRSENQDFNKKADRMSKWADAKFRLYKS